MGVTINGHGHRRLFDQAWDASQGRVTFLGDWHTHPGGPAVPSERDRNAAARLATDSDFGTPRPLIAIVATRRWPIGNGAPGQIAWVLREPDGDLHGLDDESFSTLAPYAAAVSELW
jgi:proteasome lid subunit RPN8/RPN11